MKIKRKVALIQFRRWKSCERIWWLEIAKSKQFRTKYELIHVRVSQRWDKSQVSAI